MTAKEFNLKQLEKQSELLHSDEPKTQLEKDIYNLKYIRYGIKHGSLWYRSGVIRSLDRAIAMLCVERLNPLDIKEKGD